MPSVPFTWEEMLRFGESTMPLDACEICKHVPAYSRDELPELGKLEMIVDTVPHTSLYRCPICHRLYQSTYAPYEYLAWGSEDAYTSYLRVEPRDVFRGLTEHRIADDRFGRALAVLVPGLAVEKRAIVDTAKSFFPRHHVVQLACGEDRLWIALSDEGEVVRCTLDELARIAASAPPPKLDHVPAAVEYAGFVDRVTSEDGSSIVESFAEIPWRANLTAEERAYIDELRAASAVEPQHVEQLADRVVVRRWIVARQRLSCRVLTVFPSGEVWREDAVIGEAIPTR